MHFNRAGYISLIRLRARSRAVRVACAHLLILLVVEIDVGRRHLGIRLHAVARTTAGTEHSREGEVSARQAPVVSWACSCRISSSLAVRRRRQTMLNWTRWRGGSVPSRAEAADGSRSARSLQARVEPHSCHEYSRACQRVLSSQCGQCAVASAGIGRAREHLTCALLSCQLTTDSDAKTGRS